MSRARRPLAALVLIAVIALVSGCGSTAPSSTGSAGTGDNGTTQRDKAERFSQCMRSNGIDAFPDPDASGNLTIDQVANGSSINPSSPAFTRALDACKSLEPTNFTGTTRTPQQMKAARRWARCIRANGVSDFPDPTASGPPLDTNRVPSAATSSGMSVLRAALQKCTGYAAAMGITR